MKRENFVISEEDGELFTMLAKAMKTSKTELLVKWLHAECERRSELLEIYKQQQELEKKAKRLRG